MFNSFQEEARKVLIVAKEEMKNLNHPYVSSEHLLLAILKGDNEITDKLSEYDLDYKTFKNEIIKVIGKGTKSNEFFLYTPLLKRIIENAELTEPIPLNTVNFFSSTPSISLTWSTNFLATCSVLVKEAPSGRVILAINTP